MDPEWSKNFGDKQSAIEFYLKYSRRDWDRIKHELTEPLDASED